jgi:hypothetical protein
MKGVLNCLANQLVFGRKVSAESARGQAGFLHDASDTNSIETSPIECFGRGFNDFLPGKLFVTFWVTHTHNLAGLANFYSRMIAL